MLTQSTIISLFVDIINDIKRTLLKFVHIDSDSDKIRTVYVICTSVLDAP